MSFIKLGAIVKFKRGAMFGLDARVALAIFGALSVISGAALYSAIKEAKSTALLAQLEEYSKAYYAYYLDVGVELPNFASNLFDVETSELVSSTKVGWKGPYISDLPRNGTYSWKMITPNYGLFYYMRATDADWNDVAGLNAASCDKLANKSKCKAWIIFTEVDKSIFNSLDEKIDSSDGVDKGKIRSSTGVELIYMIGTSNVTDKI